MKRCVIIGGAPINDYEKIKTQLDINDYFVVCDCGLTHIPELGIEPNLIVGDFDSFENPDIDCETITLPREKDDTDTFFAVKEAIMRGYDEFLLIGVIGKRLDHSLGNISILYYLDELGFSAKIIDDYSEMEIISRKTAYIPDKYPYFSLLNLSGTAKGINIKNSLFPLENGEITPNYQYGISNEVLKGKTAEVTINEGKLLLVKIAKE